MEEWKEYSLSDIAKYSQGKQISINLQFEKEDNSLIRFIRIVDYTSNWSQPPRYVAKDPKYQIKSDDIVMIRYGTPGKVFRGHEGLIANNMFKISVNEDIIEKGYAYWYLSMDQVFKQLMSIQASTTMPAISFGMLKNITINVPSKNIQKKIVSILDNIDDKIEVNRRINEQLEELSQALFKSWFVDFEPFKDGNFVESELGMIPDGWKVGTFSEIVDSTLGGDWGKENLQGNYTKEVFCIRGADIPEIKNGNRGKMPIRYILEKNYLKKALTENDLVIEISGGSPTQSTGRVCRITSELVSKYNNALICTNFCRAIKPCDSYSSFIYYYWQYLYDQGRMFNYENGTTGIKNLMINDILEKEQVVIPKINVVKQYNDVIQTIATKIQKNGEEIETLTNLRDTLLPKLMSGEIDVNEVKI